LAGGRVLSVADGRRGGDRGISDKEEEPGERRDCWGRDAPWTSWVKFVRGGKRVLLAAAASAEGECLKTHLSKGVDHKIFYRRKVSNIEVFHSVRQNGTRDQTTLERKKGGGVTATRRSLSRRPRQRGSKEVLRNLGNLRTRQEERVLLEPDPSTAIGWRPLRKAGWRKNSLPVHNDAP